MRLEGAIPDQREGMKSEFKLVEDSQESDSGVDQSSWLDRIWIRAKPVNLRKDMYNGLEFHSSYE